jgi:hypothetical protein
MMTEKMERRERPIWRNILIGLCLLFMLVILIVILIVAIPLGYYAYDRHMKSILFIQNWSGSDVRLEKVILDDQILWEGRDIVLKSKRNLDKSGLEPEQARLMPYFCAPKKSLELKLVFINEFQERETVSCTLDNRSRPCFFEVSYKKGKLFCGDCDKWHLD